MIYRHNIPNLPALLSIWKIEESIEALSIQLNKQTLADPRYQKLKNEVRKKEWLCTRLLIKKLCGEEKTVVYNKNGKPSLKDNSYQISISHTKNYVAVLLHPSLEVGIDIEKHSDRVLKLKEKFMSNSEINNIDSFQIIEHVLLHWSAKETLFKILPETEVDFIEHLHIHPFSVSTEGSFTAEESRSSRQEKFTLNYSLFKDFVLTWTSK